MICPYCDSVTVVIGEDTSGFVRWCPHCGTVCPEYTDEFQVPEQACLIKDKEN